MNSVHTMNHLPVDPSLGRAGTVGKGPSQSRTADPSGRGDFEKLLREELGAKPNGLTFSAHARDRIRTRNIQMGPEAMERLQRAVDTAEAKGAKDALVLMPGSAASSDLALVVSITNRTVITAMDGDTIKDNVFTKIDSAVVAR